LALVKDGAQEKLLVWKRKELGKNHVKPHLLGRKRETNSIAKRKAIVSR